VTEALSVLTVGKGVSPIDLMIALIGLGLVPVIAVAATSFTRIIVVLGLLRSAIGAASLPPTIVLTSLAVALTGIIMAPTFARVEHDAIAPYAARRITPSEAVERAQAPLRAFMLRQTRSSDLEAFARLQGAAKNGDPPGAAVAVAFIVDELRAAFAMGFALALPFAAIDLIVSGVLMSLGMYMVSPASVALPLKLLLFVAANGWALVAGALVASYR
jgi:flagellar biosynthesis protein FliP